ncbi:UNVERIFIED_CONTAM: ATP-dependent helicase, partial [Bacillus amyloliquefaciens DSM 7 = ATCC 23350]
IEEIFNLVSLLKPGHLGSQNHFQEEFAKKKSSLEAHEHLKDLVNKVMIRNRRHDTGLNWKQRHVETVPIEFSPSEQALYDEISSLKEGINKPASMFSIMT